MNSSWSGPSDSSSNKKNDSNPNVPTYRALVVDSGPIIKQAQNKLYGKAEVYYTVPGVMEEIRDAKARQALQQWPMELQVRECTPESYERIVQFSKQTGDYNSLSMVDIQVCALTLDLEQEGTIVLDHIRTTPKRTIGLGNIQTLNKNKTDASDTDGNENKEKQEGEQNVDYDIVEDDDDDDDDDDEDVDNQGEEDEANAAAPQPVATKPAAPKTWAALVNPTAGTAPVANAWGAGSAVTAVVSQEEKGADEPTGGQFDDADDGEDELEDQFDALNVAATEEKQEENIEAELATEFPSLTAASTVPYEGSDDEAEPEDEKEQEKKQEEKEAKAVEDKPKEEKDMTEEELREWKKQQALKPVSKSGKKYNSFRKYGKLMKPAAPKPKAATNNMDNSHKTALLNLAKDETDAPAHSGSKIIGAGGGGGEQMTIEDDDGEGWITSKSDMSAMKAANGMLDPMKTSKNINGNGNQKKDVGPPLSQRTACTTTDFAVQNVLLQMNVCLLSIDGMQVRKVKNWVIRCGACFKIHAGEDGTTTFNGKMKRLFCSHCGSGDLMQRIACSVDGKTGRLKLHLKKNYRHNNRGTKFSLPKPGSGNRFQGDLLLREDQMMSGAWNQKVKVRGGSQSRAHAQSMFGKDIASNVGCHASALNDDLKVGFGRRNPNSAKGRERRGKKKKSSDRACGLRRY